MGGTCERCVAPCETCISLNVAWQKLPGHRDVTGGFISLGIIHHVDVANSALGISLQRL